MSDQAHDMFCMCPDCTRVKGGAADTSLGRSDQRTATELFRHMKGHCPTDGHQCPYMIDAQSFNIQLAAQTLYEDLLARLPEKTDVSQKIDTHEYYNAGYNKAIDRFEAILRAYFLVGEA